MSRHLDPAQNHSRTTDHGHEIGSMRAWAEMLSKGDPFAAITTVSGDMPAGTLATIVNAAADLLEVHDATGISLDNWDGPKELVLHALVLMAFPVTAFLPNGV